MTFNDNNTDAIENFVLFLLNHNNNALITTIMNWTISIISIAISISLSNYYIWLL